VGVHVDELVDVGSPLFGTPTPPGLLLPPLWALATRREMMPPKIETRGSFQYKLCADLTSCQCL